MTGQEYVLTAYRASMHGRLEFKVDYTFTIVPLDVVKIEMYDVEGKPLNKVKKISAKEKELFIYHLKDFLFRKKSVPLNEVSNTPTMWHIHPEFDEETKKEIKRMYLFDEL